MSRCVLGLDTDTPTGTLVATDTPTETPTGTLVATDTPTATGIVTTIVPDFDNNGVVDSIDLLMLLRRIGTKEQDYDLNGDGEVDYEDVMIFSQWWQIVVPTPTP